MFRQAFGLAVLATAAARLIAADIEGNSKAAPIVYPGGVVNAAGFAPAPENFVAPLSIISIFGVDLSLRTHGVTQADLVRGELPPSLAGVVVSIGLINIPLYYVSPTQINAQLPELIVPREQPWTIRVIREGLAGELAAEVNVRTTAPGLFPVVTHQDFSVVGRDPQLPSTPALPGELVVLFGTGFGPVSPAVRGGVLPAYAARVVYPSSVRLGAELVPPENVLYVGQTPFSAGLYQVNLVLPEMLAPGDWEVFVEVGGAVSKKGVVIAVGP